MEQQRSNRTQAHLRMRRPAEDGSGYGGCPSVERLAELWKRLVISDHIVSTSVAMRFRGTQTLIGTGHRGCAGTERSMNSHRNAEQHAGAGREHARKDEHFLP